jgi:acetyl-CoA synthetase
MRGRADDVIKVSGHRIGTAELEEAASSHPAVSDAVAVGRPDEIKGESIVICVVLKDKTADSRAIPEIVEKVESAIGKFARPDEVRIVADLPKTRTGKLLRRLVKARVSGHEIGSQDLSSIENPSCLDQI